MAQAQHRLHEALWPWVRRLCRKSGVKKSCGKWVLSTIIPELLLSSGSCSQSLPAFCCRNACAWSSTFLTLDSDPDLLAWLSGLIFNLSHHYRLAWWSEPLAEPCYHHQACSALCSQVLWGCCTLVSEATNLFALAPGSPSLTKWPALALSCQVWLWTFGGYRINSYANSVGRALKKHAYRKEYFDL